MKIEFLLINFFSFYFQNFLQKKVSATIVIQIAFVGDIEWRILDSAKIVFVVRKQTFPFNNKTGLLTEIPFV